MDRSKTEGRIKIAQPESQKPPYAKPPFTVEHAKKVNDAAKHREAAVEHKIKAAQAETEQKVKDAQRPMSEGGESISPKAIGHQAAATAREVLAKRAERKPPQSSKAKLRKIAASQSREVVSES